MEKAVQEDLMTNFRWYDGQPALYVCSLADLYDDSLRSQHLARLVSDFGSPTTGHAASITAKRIGYAAALMIFVFFKYGVSVNPKECMLLALEETSEASGWLPHYVFPLNTASEIKSDPSWIAKELYAKTLVPLVSLLAQEKGIARVVLFENIFTYIKWIFTSKLEDTETFQKLLDIPFNDYGVKKQHPLAFYEQAPSASRRTCCLSYQTCGGNRACKTCPLFSHGNNANQL
jgi:ferric iron reductase protein FhuF